MEAVPADCVTLVLIACFISHMLPERETCAPGRANGTDESHRINLSWNIEQLRLRHHNHASHSDVVVQICDPFELQRRGVVHLYLKSGAIDK